MLAFDPPAPRRMIRSHPGHTVRRALLASLALLALGQGAPARSAIEMLETVLAVERQHAQQQAAAVPLERLKTASTRKIAVLDAESAAAREQLAALQKDLVAQLTRDDAIALKVLRIRVAASQYSVEASEGEKALILKVVEDAERDQDAWKKRAATLELALRMDMKTMLASPADIDDRERRVDAALKEIDSQIGQVRKYASRRAAAAAEWTELDKRVAETAAALRTAASPEWRAALEEQLKQLRRLEGQQEQWMRLNKQSEDRSRRNVAFARADALISRRYADALARKADLQRAAEAQTVAESADAQLAALRTALKPIQQRAAGELAAAATQNDEALKLVGDARTAGEQTRGHAAYAAAQSVKNRWEAETDCWKELLALQKAGAAFAHELADRARGMAEDRTIFDINQDERQLRESLDTSEQYVRSLDQMVQKTDAAVDACCRDLGLTRSQISALAAPLTDLMRDFNAAHPPSLALFSDQLKALAEKAAGSPGPEAGAPGRDGQAAATLAARVGQRELLKARKLISERWLENSRNAIKGLERLAGTTLWQQHDPRLNAMTCLEAGELLGALGSDATFAWDCLRFHLGNVPGVPARRAAAKGLLLLAAVGVAGWVASRLISATPAMLWLLGRLVSAVPLLLAAAWLIRRTGTENLALHAAGLLLLGLAAWLALRYVLLGGCAEHRPPSGTTMAGGFYAALINLGAWTALMAPLHRLAGQAVNAWDTQAVIERLWLFGAGLALFRLLLHPTLMGRLLSRRSKNRGLRWLGTSMAIACTIAAALAALPYLAGLDNLGSTVLSTVEASFIILAAALAGTALTGWTLRRETLKPRAGDGLVRTIQTAIAIAAGAAVLWIWWGLLNRVVLAPNAPPLVQDLVRLTEQVARSTLNVWRKELSAGMTVGSLVRGILVFVLSFWVSRAVKRHFLERVLARTPMDETTRVTFSTILGYVVILLGFLVGVNVAGSSLQNLALLAGAITVGLGFGLQNVINNFVSSLLIHFGRTIRAGDYIEVGGTRGTVREIGLRSTMITTDDGITVLVPNGSFVSANIVNWTNPSRRIRLHASLVVTRQADLMTVTETAIAIARNHPLVVKEPTPVVEVRAVTATQVNLELLAWTEKPERLTTVVGELNLALDRALREKGYLV